ncbi:endonuclease/exonuclease/phosphatase family protein [Asanoa ishikariensis]|nr:endonuclease/exonuclease/phosphatase family protein [Asanoa ishikariensis]
MRARRILAGALAALALGTVGVAQPAQAGGHPSRIKVMTLNVFYGGDELDLATGDFCAEPDACTETLTEVKRVIQAAGADIVGIQEPERNTSRIARLLGWYSSDRAHVMSRFPIIDPPDSDGLYVFVEVAPGRVVAVANMHLPSDPYGPYLVRDGGTRSDVLKLERDTRLAAAKSAVKPLPKLARQGIPVFLTGDFNSPSHLDWTQAVDDARDDVPFAVDWPASHALADAGLKDTFREAHPNPVKDPGFTWTPGGPESDPHEVYDRIDWVLRAGPGHTVASRVVGERDVDPYPTDHRGVVSTVDVTPAVPPVLAAPRERNVDLGDPIVVDYHGTDAVTLRDDAGRLIARQATPRQDGTVRFATRDLKRGRYTVNGAPVWLYPRDEPVRVATTKTSYRTGEKIAVDFSNAPGMGLDWISVFRAGDGNDAYLAYAYTGSLIEGRLSIGPDGIGDWPLPPGRYVVRLLPDDGLRSVAESKPFTVRK